MKTSKFAPYPEDSEVEVVRLYRESGKTLRAMAEDLGVRTNLLRAWSKQLGVDEGVRSGLK